MGDHRVAPGVRERAALVTSTTGVPDGPPALLLHDRFLDHRANDALGAALAPTHRVISVRSARPWLELGAVTGYYWFLGPLESPDIATLGDGLTHLQRLVRATHDETGQPVLLVGTGEGGTIALLVALAWPDLVAGVASIDGPLPARTDALPVKTLHVPRMPMLLVSRNKRLSGTSIALSARGALVETATADDLEARLARWAASLPPASV